MTIIFLNMLTDIESHKLRILACC